MKGQIIFRFLCVCVLEGGVTQTRYSATPPCLPSLQNLLPATRGKGSPTARPLPCARSEAAGEGRKKLSLFCSSFPRDTELAAVRTPA
ncbi:hypothetical protein scyTo_0014991 [Scyliorhinus torazame]|uniref:Secreted protein n=1 Tax=Scyliorhinus torazame TaxID=75743 RepID=A0A401NZS2_SCYTO|nr:hypothetical protein [Scyliorhinus torazame]